MQSKIVLLSICCVTINLFTRISCSDETFNEKGVEPECLNCLDPNGDIELTDFFKTNGSVWPCEEVLYPEDDKEFEPKDSLRVESFTIKSYIKYRYVTTYVTSLFINRKSKVYDAVFSIFLPNKAYIANFAIEINGKLHTSRFGKRTEKVNESGGKPEHGNKLRNFHIRMKLKPSSVAKFHLLYEELLERRHSEYELSLNIHPGQIVKNLDVEVFINENQPLRFINVPVLKIPNERGKNITNLIPKTKIVRKTDSSALIKFQPTRSQQMAFIKALRMNAEKGLNVQFTVQYDLQRDSSNGEILIDGPYFVHFFAPKHLKALPKHVIFVLDTSGSMSGKRLRQLQKAMRTILPQLKPDDLFNIIEFAGDVYVNDIKNKRGFRKVLNYQKIKNYDNFEQVFENKSLPEAVKATKENINVATESLKKLKAYGRTNMVGALGTSILIMKRSRKIYKEKYEPMILFITDGEPNIPGGSKQETLKIVTKLNANVSSIVTISLGNMTDYGFLNKLSQLNHGEARFIEKDSDISALIEKVFQDVSTPVLNNIRFTYGIQSTEITNTQFATYFQGTELIVAGKIDKSNLSPIVLGGTQNGRKIFRPHIGHSSTPLDRLWSYLMLHQDIKRLTNTKASNMLTQKALNLATKYSFVTPLTSLAIDLPNGESIDDDQMLTPPYKPIRNLNAISTTVNETQRHQRKFALQFTTTTTSTTSTKTTTTTKGKKHTNRFSGNRNSVDSAESTIKNRASFMDNLLKLIEKAINGNLF